MKKGCSVIIVIVAILWIIGSMMPDDTTENSEESEEVRPERALATRIDNSTFYNQENNLASSIKFTSDNTGWFGAAVLKQLGCSYVYSYSLDGDKIILSFTNSDCGRHSSDRIFYYDKTGDYIYTVIENQKYIFK
jgi:hypothetical protein